MDYLTGGLLGILAGSATISQGITYLLRHRDGRDFRSLVCFVLVLGLGHLVLTMSDLITTCAAWVPVHPPSPIKCTDVQIFAPGNAISRRETSASTRIHSPMYSAMLVLDGLITGIVQAFYGYLHPLHPPSSVLTFILGGVAGHSSDATFLSRFPWLFRWHLPYQHGPLHCSVRRQQTLITPSTIGYVSFTTYSHLQKPI